MRKTWGTIRASAARKGKRSLRIGMPRFISTKASRTACARTFGSSASNKPASVTCASKSFWSAAYQVGSGYQASAGRWRVWLSKALSSACGRPAHVRRLRIGQAAAANAVLTAPKPDRKSVTSFLSGVTACTFVTAWTVAAINASAMGPSAGKPSSRSVRSTNMRADASMYGLSVSPSPA